MEIQSFRDLVVWQKAMSLVEDVYALTEHFPHSEMFGLRAQLRRAAVSIASNIAEGHARKTGYYVGHLSIAIGSQAEVQTQIELAYRLKLVAKNEAEIVLDRSAEVAKMLHGLIASVEKRKSLVPDP